MDLKEYVVERSSFNIRKMAEDLGCSYTHLYHVVNKECKASYNFSKKIEKYTRGAVKAVDIVEYTIEKKHARKNPPETTLAVNNQETL